MENYFSSNTRILVIDDMPTICQIVAQALRGMGYTQIITAHDGTEGWNLLNKPDHGIDIVISDWNMPQMPGIELLKKVRESEQHKHMPFILLTGENEVAQITAAAASGVDGYILKPFTAAAFKDKFMAAVKKRLASAA